jgi:hypothetical protein
MRKNVQLKPAPKKQKEKRLLAANNDESPKTSTLRVQLRSAPLQKRVQLQKAPPTKEEQLNLAPSRRRIKNLPTLATRQKSHAKTAQEKIKTIKIILLFSTLTPSILTLIANVTVTALTTQGTTNVIKTKCTRKHLPTLTLENSKNVRKQYTPTHKTKTPFATAN